MPMPYTEREIEIIREMAEAGKTPDDVLAVLKSRTIEGLKAISRREGIKFKLFQPEIDEAAFKKLMRK